METIPYPAPPPPEGADPDFPYVQVEGRHGQFVVNYNDIYVGTGLIEYGEYCEVEWCYFSRFLQAGATAIDAGANIGALAVPMAKKVGAGGRVFAFEPQPAVFACLKENAQLNMLPQLTPVQAGLGKTKGVMQAALPDYKAFGSFAGYSLYEQGTGLTAQIVALDECFQSSRLDFIKMDIEGMECAALEGAQQTFKKFQPVLYIENDKPEHSEALIEWLLKMDYRLWWHTTTMFNPHNYRGQTQNIYGLISNINMICLPKNRTDLWVHIPPSLLPVKGPTDSLRNPQGEITASFAE